MNIHHKNIFAQLQKSAKKPTFNPDAARYIGSSHPLYPISVPQLRDIAKAWAKENKDISAKELEVVLDSLVEGESYHEKALAGILLEYTKKVRGEVSLKKLGNRFLHLEGWAEIDSMASGKFSDKEILSRWDEWRKFVVQLSKSKHIQQRRASIVLLTKPLSHTTDEGLQALAFEVISRLQHEKDIQITKAISWLLRSMARHHTKAVKLYLKENETLLPAIAVRETKRKLETGKK
jgi:3-methyladenine DNA glycosylase AlkD